MAVAQLKLPRGPTQAAMAHVQMDAIVVAVQSLGPDAPARAAYEAYLKIELPRGIRHTSDRRFDQYLLRLIMLGRLSRNVKSLGRGGRQSTLNVLPAPGVPRRRLG